jgi:hypothetical protein
MDKINIVDFEFKESETGMYCFEWSCICLSKNNEYKKPLIGDIVFCPVCGNTFEIVK